MSRSRLPAFLIPDLVRGETIGSFAHRLERLQGAHPGQYLAVATAELRRTLPRQPSLETRYERLRNLLREDCALESDTLAAGLWPLNEGWVSCPRCGPVVEIHPDAAHLVCALHACWTGPHRQKTRARAKPASQGPQHGAHVGADVITATRYLHEIGRTQPTLVTEALSRARSMRAQGRAGDLTPEDVPTAALIVATTLDPECISLLAITPTQQALRHAIADLVRRTSLARGWFRAPAEPVTDEAWLILRATIANARQRLALESRVDEFQPALYVANPEALGEWPTSSTGMLDYLSTFRTDQQWWRDRFIVEENPGPRAPGRWTVLCPAGHALQRSDLKRVNGRPHTDFYCNVCAGTRRVPAITSLEARFPTIAQTWHPSLNGTVTPSDILPGSRRYFWWLCSKGHSWPATVAARTAKGSGCPYCAGTAIVQGEQDFATTHPHLVSFWDGTVEQPGPNQVSARNHGRKIHLRCPSGHTFTRSPLRFAQTPTCPYCDGRVLVPGRNDFATTHPQNADWWHPTENGALLPSDVRGGSNVRVMWLCPSGHSFAQTIGYVAKRTTPSCPICSGRKLRQGVNDAATKYPVITPEWADDLNPVAASETVPGSGHWWWRCLLKGHELAMTVHERAHAGGCTDCPADDRIGERFSVNAPSHCAPPVAEIRARVQNLRLFAASETPGAPRLADEVWDSIADAIVEASPQALVDRRAVVTAILYVLSLDLRWEDTPRTLSAASTAWKWFHNLRLAGAWDAAIDALSQPPNGRGWVSHRVLSAPTRHLVNADPG